MSRNGARKKTISKSKELELTESLIEVPSNMSLALDLSEKIKSLSNEVVNAKVLYFLEEVFLSQLRWREH